MKGTSILVEEYQGRPAAALVRDGVLDDFLIDPPDDIPRPGSIFRVRIGRPLKGQAGRIAQTPNGSGFLRQAAHLPEGSFVLAQVTGFAEPGKAIPLTTRILFKSRTCIVTPGAPGTNVSRAIKDEERRSELNQLAADTNLPDGTGLIVRSAASEDADEDIQRDLELTVELAQDVLSDGEETIALLLDGPTPELLAWREWTDVALSDVDTSAGCFDAHDMTASIEALADPGVPLAGGGRMYVEPTRALVAVDVNTGGDTSPASGLKANLATAAELPRALRLRGLGGQVTIDLAPMAKKHRRDFETMLRKSLRVDPIETSLVGWTPSGHMELQRKRERLPMGLWRL